MPQLTQAQKDYALRESGYDPASYDIDDNWYITPKAPAAQPAALANGLPQPMLRPAGPQAEGAISTFAREGLHAAPAAAAGGLGAWGGAALGAPLGPVGMIAGGIIGGLGVGMGTSYAQNKIEEAYLPEYVAQRQANLAANPVAGMAGRLATMPLGGMGASLPNVGRAAGDVVSRVTGATSKLNPAQTANLANVGIGAGLGTGIGVGTQLAQGRPLGETLTSMDTLEALLGGAVFNKPNSIGKAYGWQDIPASAPRITDDPRIAAMQAELARTKQATAQPAITPEQQALIDLASKGLTEKKEGQKWTLGKTDILTANQAAEQRGINPAKSAELEAQRVQQAGLLTPEEIYQQKVRRELERLAADRRKADFEKATLELQQQQAQAQAETAQAQAAKQELKQRQQLQMKLGVQATPEAITARGITTAPENRPATPRGNNKRVARMQEEMVDPLQDEADAIQDRLERKNQEPDDSLIDTELRREAIEAKAGTPLGDFAKALFDARAKEMGADVGTTTEKGSFALLSDKLKRMSASIGTTEGADTRAHEVIGHIYNKMLELSPYESDKRIQHQMLKAASESPELAAINERRVAAGKEAWTPDEFVANQQGLEWLIRNAKKESPNRAWFEQWKAGMKSVMGNANAADLRRLVDYKWHNDAPFNEYFGIKTAGDAAASAGARVNQPFDEGFNTKEGDDILSSNEDIPVRDRTKPMPEAIAAVKELGYTYDGLQNFGAPGLDFHAFTRRGDKAGDPGAGATFYVPQAHTSTDNIIAAARAKNEAFGVKRVEQPEGEALDMAKLNEAGRKAAYRAKLRAEREALGLPVGPNSLGKTGRPNEGKTPEGGLVSLDKLLPSGKGTIGDLIPDRNAVMPGESIGDVSLQDLPNAPVAAKPAKETLEERIARKADEQMKRLAETAPDNEAAQTVAKRVAPEEIVHTAELDQNYADMYDIVNQRVKELNEDRADAVEEHGEDSEYVEKIDKKLSDQQKMLEWISKQDLTARVDLKGIKKVYQPADESLTADKRNFMLSSERVVRDVKGFQPIGQILGTIKNKVPPAEWAMLQDLGIEKAFGPAQRVNAAEVLQWLQKNEQKVEVRKMGASEQTEAQKLSAQLRHELDTKFPGWALEDGQQRDRTGNIIREGYLANPEYFELKREYSDAVGKTWVEAGQQNNTHWRSIAPKPESEMKDYVEIAVVKGKGAKLKSGIYNPNAEDIKFPSSHNFPPNTLGFVRGYMEGDTFHVIEVQSDWAQQQHKLEQNKNVYDLDPAENQRINKENISRSADPLLAHYERLALKSAIEHARASGAKRIAIQDAESAMLMEGHDRHPDMRQTETLSDTNPRTGEPVTREDVIKWLENDDQNPSLFDIKHVDNSWHVRKARPEQEKGMRLHYDPAFMLLDPQGNIVERFPTADDASAYARHNRLRVGEKENDYKITQGMLPKILGELTGEQGEKVSFGEHKMAFKPASRTYGYPENTVTRDDLIFRNQDGSPKTDITALSFKLPESRTEPYSYFERRNQPADESLPFIYERTGAVGKGILHTIGAEVDKLKAISPEAGKGAEDFLTYLRARRGELEGSFNYDLRQVRKAQNVKEYWFQDNEDYQKVVQWRDAMQDGEGEPFALTPTQQAINEVVNKNLKASLDLRESFKKEGDIDGLARGTAGKPHYLPHVMARDVATTLAEQPTSAKATALLRDFIAYRQEKAGQTEAEARADWKTIRNSFNMVEEGNIASRFGAIDKALGKGLPKSMREQHLMDRMGRFNRRFARRVAFHEAIQRNPKAREAFFSDESGAASTTVGKNILRDMFGIREHTEATRSAISGVVRALMLGPLTGAKDVVSGQVLGLQHMGLEQVLPAKMEALAKYGENYKKAIETGVVRNGYGGLESGEGGLRNVQAIMERSRDVINQVQGRQMLETVSRVLNYGEGKFLVADAFRAIEQGRLTAQKRGFLDDFVPDWQQYKNKPVPQRVLDEAAARFVESVQGTYDYRGLPAVAMQGTFSPYLSLARWNIEKFNNFTKKVVDPAMKGNYQPLLMATLGAFIGGTAVNALVEEVSGRKERTAKWSEIAASKEQTGLIGYKLAALASMAGYAGILGDVVKSGFDAKYKNRVQTFSNPLIDAGATIIEDAKFLVQAMEEGDLPAVTDVLHLLANDYIQAYRIALPHVSDEKKKELEATNKRRDLKVWKMGEGQELSAASTMRPNPLIGKAARQFKQTDDMNEAAALVPELVDKAIEKATIDGIINPEILKAELSKYKRNSYQTVPNPQESPIAASHYIDFLSKTQGTNEALRRIEDYMRRNAINQAKSKMIPTIQ